MQAKSNSPNNPPNPPYSLTPLPRTMNRKSFLRSLTVLPLSAAALKLGGLGSLDDFMGGGAGAGTGARSARFSKIGLNLTILRLYFRKQDV